MIKYTAFLILFICFENRLVAQKNHNGLKGSVERVKVHSKNLEGNLAGDSPDRDVSIYLPPGYKKNDGKRYPVVYFLHGYTDNDAQWYGFVDHWINLPKIADSVFVSWASKEIILVTPNGYNKYQGSMYSNSVTTGNWEDFIAKELVSYVDKHYRTIPQAKSRGLAGHSMGGYGTMRIGQKHPETFSSLYMLSPCCFMYDGYIRLDAEGMRKFESVKTIDDFNKADFDIKIGFASAAAWSPNPANPPLFLDLPVKNNERQPMIEAKWSANMPLATLDQHIQTIKGLKSIAFDAGNEDQPIATSIKILDSTLTRYGVKHVYEEYKGDHVNRIAERIAQKMLPYFAEQLSFSTTGSK
jgi:enterochelin esterase-like enzyme